MSREVEYALDRVEEGAAPRGILEESLGSVEVFLPAWGVSIGRSIFSENGNYERDFLGLGLDRVNQRTRHRGGLFSSFADRERRYTFNGGEFQKAAKKKNSCNASDYRIMSLYV